MLTRRHFLYAAPFVSAMLVCSATDTSAAVEIEPFSSGDDVESYSFETAEGTINLSIYMTGDFRIVNVERVDGEEYRIYYDCINEILSSSLTDNMVYVPEKLLGIAPNEDRSVRRIPQFDIVNGPTERKSRELSFEDLHRILGGVNNAVDIAAAVAGVIGFPIAAMLVALVNGQIGWVLQAIDNADPNHGIRVEYTETDRYEVNPATGHKTYYDTVRGFVGAEFY